MPQVEGIIIDGIPELQAKFTEIERGLRERVIKRALRKAIDIVEVAVRQTAPIGRTNRFSGSRYGRKPGSKFPAPHVRGTLRMSVKSKVGVVNTTDAEATVYIDKKDAWYAHMVEFGHDVLVPRGPTKPVRMFKKARYDGRGFMRAAWEANQEKVLSTFVEVLNTDITKMVG